eukprot:3082048-Amphidinium_carterae.1
MRGTFHNPKEEIVSSSPAMRMRVKGTNLCSNEAHNVSLHPYLFPHAWKSTVRVVIAAYGGSAFSSTFPFAILWTLGTKTRVRQVLSVLAMDAASTVTK